MRVSGIRWLAPVGSKRLAAGLLSALVAVASFSWAAVPADSNREEAVRAEALAQDQKILSTATKDSEIMLNLTYLSDVIGPRLTGSAALKRANDWAAEKMKSYGLSHVDLEGWTIPAGWERGSATARIIEPDNGRSLSLASLGWTPGTKGKIEADVVIFNAKNSKELLPYKGKLKDAIVLRGPPAVVRPFNEPAPPPRTTPTRPGESATPEKKPEPGKEPDKTTPPIRPNYAEQMAFRRELMEFLRTEGAAVLLQDAAKPLNLLTTTGGWQGTDRASATEPLPAAYMAHEHYALLHRLASRPGMAKTRVAIEITNKQLPGPVAVYNTVGEIRGSEKPDEFVILGAHLDSWDLAQGTTDNGTGTAVVLEAARILARSAVKPRRTIRFVLFTGEEQGLHGSRAYVQKHKEELPRISMCLVHDTGTGKVTGIGLQGRAILKPLLESELAALKDLGCKDVNLRSMGGSDHASFEKEGVPGFAVQQDMSEYRLTHHSQSDTMDKAHEPDLIQGAQVMAVTALRIANMPQLLPREKPTRARE